MKKYYSNVDGRLTIPDIEYVNAVTGEKKVLVLQKKGDAIPNDVHQVVIDKSRNVGNLKSWIEKGLIIEKEVDEKQQAQPIQETSTTVISRGKEVEMVKEKEQPEVISKGGEIIKGKEFLAQNGYGYLTPNSKEGKVIAAKVAQDNPKEVEEEMFEEKPIVATGYLTPDSKKVKKEDEDKFDEMLGITKKDGQAKTPEEIKKELDAIKKLKIFAQYSVIANSNDVVILQAIADDKEFKDSVMKRAKNKIKKLAKK